MDKPALDAGQHRGHDLAADLAAEAGVLQREIDEIALLLRQVRTEAERHQSRRAQTAERFEALLAESGAGAELRDAHAQLVLQTQRSVLMDAQVEVLEGKHKTLLRFAAHLTATIERLSLPERGVGTRVGAEPSAGEQDPRAVLASQEDMRRQIARQMHDGPAQSIANIALQAEIVQRLLPTDRGAGERELGQLRQMVQHALEETKNFIFDVRPMVLDDLGLVPTLRRATNDRARRAERLIRFESVGADRRLAAELESALFRIIDDAVGGFLEAEAEEVSVRLNWTDEELSVSVGSYDGGTRAPTEPTARGAKTAEPLPPALAAMIQDQRHRERVKTTPSLPASTYGVIQARAAAVGIDVDLQDEGRLLTTAVRLR